MALFHPKIKLFVEGRKRVLAVLEHSIKETDRIIWVHVASLGEFEQGLPVIKKLRKAYPNHKILVTFFSPSGYEVKKNTDAADLVVYLPIDTKSNARKFISLAHPELVIFVKYEIWPNYLKVLKEQKIPTLLISAIFNKKQAFFKWYGGLMRSALKTFSHFFVQNQDSIQLLSRMGLMNVTLSGDTRFDRVSEILDQDNELDFMNILKGNHKCLVAGSSWPEDEEILVKFINTSEKKLKYVLAPHNIRQDHIASLKKSISKKTLLYSEFSDSESKKQSLVDCDVIIIDTIGLLTKIYSYADIAYVGGGFATGLHNTLEPAVFGIPVITGPQYKGFNEAETLVDKKGILVVNNEQDFTSTVNILLDQPIYLKATGEINSNYINKNKGASIQIIEHIRRLL